MASGAKALFLEDLAIGQKFRSGSIEVTEDEIVAFAKQFDPQPFHLGNESAKKTIFAGLAASGWHTAALTMRLLIDGALPISGGTIGLGAEVSWPRPVRPGDRLTAESEIVEITPSRSKPNQALVTVRTTTRNQNDETVQSLTSKILAFNKGHIPGGGA